METKQVYLFCEAGMSTSIMVNKIMDVVKENNMPLVFTAHPMTLAQEKIDEEKPLCIVLGPQVKFAFKKMSEQFEPQGVPVLVIDPAAYGTMNGEAVIKKMLFDLQQRKQKSIAEGK